jgi:hypothetical protein
MQAFKLLLLSFPFIIISCQKEVIKTTQINDSVVPDSLQINEIQVLGSHNSYRTFMDKDVEAHLFSLSHLLPSSLDLKELDYAHIPLQQQFYDYGIRQIELDLYLDPDGGRFYNRKGQEMVERPNASNIPALQKPGIKIMHIPDIDYNTHYFTFIDALKDIKSFSDANPNHLPISILLEMKSETINDYLPNLGFASSLPWDLPAFLAMETEILSIFALDDIIKPDDIRQNESTLKQGVLINGWPTVGESRGKVMFMFSNTNSQNAVYKINSPSLENRLCFTNANPMEDDAAFLMYNDPVADFDDIKTYAELGFIIRSRADAGTTQARTGDYTDWNACLASGAHFISTDYYKPDHRAKNSNEWTNYAVGFSNSLYQVNAVMF